MLTGSVAQEIARETSAIIGFNVLITDGAGIVIGSGDPGRVGSFHEASVEVMRTLQPASHGPEAAHRLIGVLPGITLPVLLNHEAVGTVGITGDPEQVERFGRVVRNQTEILLRESLLLRSRLLRESAIEELLRDVAHFDPRVTEPDLIAFKAQELGHDLRLRRSVAVFTVDAPPEQPAPGPAAEPATLRGAILRALRRGFGGAHDLVGGIAPGRFVVLHHPTAGSGDDPTLVLVDRCYAVAAEVERAAGAACRVGVGGPARSVEQLHESYRDATSAGYLAERLGRPERVTHIGDLRMHDLLSTVAHGTRERFAGAVAGPLRDQPDWPVTRRTIAAWCESGFNLVRASTALRIHRNTLVYRLNKIEGSIGARFRDPRTCLALYAACLIDELER